MSQSLIVVTVVLLLALLMVQTLRVWRLRRVPVVRATRSQRIGAEAEARAVPLLRRFDFRIVERQPRARWAVWVDGNEHPVGMRADFICKRAGLTYAAEVKTGAQKRSVENPDIRRQLLEYQLAYGADAALLVDPENGSVSVVEFPLPRTRRDFGLLWFGLLLGSAATVACFALLHR